MFLAWNYRFSPKYRERDAMKSHINSADKDEIEIIAQ